MCEILWSLLAWNSWTFLLFCFNVFLWSFLLIRVFFDDFAHWNGSVSARNVAHDVDKIIEGDSSAWGGLIVVVVAGFVVVVVVVALVVVLVVVVVFVAVSVVVLWLSLWLLSWLLLWLLLLCCVVLWLCCVEVGRCVVVVVLLWLLLCCGGCGSVVAACRLR